MGSLYQCGHCISGDLETTDGQRSDVNEVAIGYFSEVEVGMFYQAGMKTQDNRIH